VINLKDIVARASARLDHAAGSDISRFPETGNTDGNGEAIEAKSISGDFPFSRTKTEELYDFEKEDIRDGEREENGSSRVEYSNAPGKRECREKPDASIVSVSRSKIERTGKREIEGALWLPSSWAEHLACLAPWSDPCPGFPFGAWRDIRARALDFAALRGADTAALGWSEAELFGVHPVAGAAGIQCVGALMLGHDITAIDPDVITMGALRYRRGLLDPTSVPVWAFDRRTPVNDQAETRSCPEGEGGRKVWNLRGAGPAGSSVRTEQNFQGGGVQ
jgi:hypothetical protein